MPTQLPVGHSAEAAAGDTAGPGDAGGLAGGAMLSLAGSRSGKAHLV